MSHPGDPWPLRLFGWLVAPRYRDDVLGDLAEDPRFREGRPGRLTAALLRAALESRWHAWRLDRSMDRSMVARARAREASTRAGRRSMLDALRQELGAAWSALRRSPGFSAAAVLTLGAGTGATLAIFTVVNGVLLSPLPYSAPERLVHIQGGEGGRYAVTMPLHDLWAERAGSLEEAAVWQGWAPTVRGADGALERRYGASVSWSWFRLLGARPAAGRLFLPEDGRPGHAPVIVVSHAAWRELLGGRADAIGGALTLDGEPYTVVGVAPPDLVDPVASHVLGGGEVAFWRADPPLFAEAATDGGWTGFWSLARLRAGARPQDARAEIVGLVREVYPEWEDDGAWLQVRTFREVATGHLRLTLLLLFAAAGLVLLIACVNVANLLLSRATTRRHEMAVRSSLGAPRRRLIRQLLTESLLLAAGGVALGLGAARLAVPPMIELVRGELRGGQAVGVDWRVAAFAAALAVATALLFGLAPALRASEVRLSTLLRSSRGARGGGERARSGLVAAEVALGVIVLVSAGLLGRTLWNLRGIDPGFDAGSVFVAPVTMLPEHFPTPAAQNAAVDAVLREVGAVPGVAAVGAITDLPMSGAVNSTSIVRPGGDPEDPAGRDQVLVRAVTPGYFDAMGIPVVRGRAIGPDDGAGARPVAVVNRSYASLLPGGGIGQTVTVRGTPREIVGVVEDVVEFRLEEGPGDPALYTPYPQEDQAWMRGSLYVTARAAGDPRALAGPVRAAALRASPALLVSRRARPLEAWISDDVAAHRLRALLLVLFAATALLLAAVGIAAVTAYTVSRRVPEIGIRLALGATAGVVVREVVGGSAAVLSGGLLAGVVGAAAATRVLRGFLFGIEPGDPWVFLAAAALLGGVGVLASWLPARRAAAVDPVRSLRAE